MGIEESLSGPPGAGIGERGSWAKPLDAGGRWRERTGTSALPAGELQSFIPHRSTPINMDFLKDQAIAAHARAAFHA